MMCSTRKRSIFVCALLVMMLMGSMTVLAAEGEAEYVPDVYATFWALVPPIVAIGLALITKEVYILALLLRKPSPISLRTGLSAYCRTATM